MEAREVGIHAVRKLLDKDVVVPDGRVIPQTRYRIRFSVPASSSSSRMNCSLLFNCGYVLLHPHQRQQRHVQPVVRRQLLVRRLRRHQPRARVRNVGQDRLSTFA